jgi:hypothetical protein
MACSTRNNNTYNAIQGPSINTVTNEDVPAIHDSPEKITGNKTWDPETGKQRNEQETNTNMETTEPTLMEDEPMKMTDKPSPKRNKKMKTDREPHLTTERTRSRS